MDFKWIIQFEDSGEAFNAFDFQNDQIILYIGMYGVPSYVVWYIAPDKTKILGLGTKFKLAMSAGANKWGYMCSYIIENIIFDVRRQKYRCFAVSVPHQKLALGTRIRSTYLTKNRDEPVSGFDFITTLVKECTMGEIEVVPIKPVTDRIKYLQVSLDPNISALDLITKICSENRWEWYLSGQKLFIGDVVKIENLNVLDKEQDVDHKKSTDNIYLSHHVISSMGAEPGMMYGKDSRVLWVKYYQSVKKGCLASIMVTPFLDIRVSEKSFISTLQEEALALGRVRLNKSLTPQQIILGKQYGTIEDYVDENLDNYEMPEFSGDPLNPSKDLRKYEFKTEFSSDESHFKYIQNAKMSTPYAGNGIGVLFPQTSGHRILFSPGGERDIGIIGPGFFGANDNVPKRDYPADFRFQFEDSGCIYYNGEIGQGNLYISPYASITIDCGGWAYNQTVPQQVTPAFTLNTSRIQMYDASGNQKLNLDGAQAYLQSKSGMISLESGGRIRIYTPNSSFTQSASFIELTTQGNFEAGSDNATIISLYGEGDKDFPFLKLQLQGTDVTIEGNVKVKGNLEATNVKASAICEGNVVKDAKGILAAKIPP